MIKIGWSSLNSELKAQIGAKLPLLRDQTLLINCCTKEKQYHPDQIIALDPVAARALKHNGALLQLARIARNEVHLFSPHVLRELHKLQEPDLQRRLQEQLSDLAKHDPNEITLTNLASSYLGILKENPVEIQLLIEDFVSLKRLSSIERAAILQRPDLNSGQLMILALTSKDLKERRFILQHPNMDTATLDGLALTSNDPIETDAILSHPKANAITRAILTTNPEKIQQIIGNPDADVMELYIFAEKLCKNDNCDAKEACRVIQQHPKSNETTRAILTRDPAPRQAIIENHNTSDDTLSGLAITADSFEERQAIRQHNNAGDATRAMLAKTAQDPQERVAIIQNQEADDSELAGLAMMSKDPEERLQIHQHPNAGFLTFANLENVPVPLILRFGPQWEQ